MSYGYYLCYHPKDINPTILYKILQLNCYHPYLLFNWVRWWVCVSDLGQGVVVLPGRGHHHHHHQQHHHHDHHHHDHHHHHPEVVMGRPEKAGKSKVVAINTSQLGSALCAQHTAGGEQVNKCDHQVRVIAVRWCTLVRVVLGDNMVICCVGWYSGYLCNVDILQRQAHIVCEMVTHYWDMVIHCVRWWYMMWDGDTLSQWWWHTECEMVTH